MLFPNTDFKRSEVIHNLRYLPPASGFRSKFAYDNLLYVVAGDLVPAVTGQSWEAFVQTRILDRIGSGNSIKVPIRRDVTPDLIRGPAAFFRAVLPKKAGPRIKSGVTTT